MDHPELAVALRHDPCGADLPRMAARGQGAIAAQIMELARAPGIEVRRDQDLAALLDTLEIDSPIALAAFAAVAEILAHLSRTNQPLRETMP